MALSLVQQSWYITFGNWMILHVQPHQSNGDCPKNATLVLTFLCLMIIEILQFVGLGIEKKMGLVLLFYLSRKKKNPSVSYCFRCHDYINFSAV